MNNLDFKQKRIYEPIDTFKVFFWIIVGNLGLSVVLAIILLNVASVYDMTYSEFVAQRGVLIMLSLTSPLLFSTIFFAHNRKNNISTIQLNLKKKPDWKVLLYVLLITACSLFLLVPFVNIVSKGFNMLGYEPSGIMYEADTPLRLVISLIISAMLPAIFEELIFRGIILNGLLKRFTPACSIILSALLFMLMHGNLQQTIYQFALGIVFGCIAYYSGSIIYSMISHFFNNALVLIIGYFIPTFFAMKDKYNMTDFILSLLYILISIIIIYLLVRCIHYTINGRNSNDNKDEKHNFYEVLDNLYGKEKTYFYIGIFLAILIWLMNTLG